MGTNCATLVADLFLFYERNCMIYLSYDNQAVIINAFNTTFSYLDDTCILNINNIYLDNMVGQIYPAELQLNKENTSDTEASVLDLQLLISNDIVSTKINDYRDSFDFEIVTFPFMMVMFLALHPMELIFLNSSSWLENLALLLTSINVINC